MISMYAEYSGRTLYVALSTDTIVGAKNGDKLYEMDTGKRYVYNESNDAWDEQPEEGGGGGGDPYSIARSILENNITEYIDPELTLLKPSSFSNSTTLNTFIAHGLEQIGSEAFYKTTALGPLAFPNLTSIGSFGLSFTSAPAIDIGPHFRTTIAQNHMINSETSIVILRSNTLVGLAATKGLPTPFQSSGTGGTLYVPSVLIADYQSATNWSTILGYTKNKILPIEGSIYETQYADGTPIPASVVIA